MRLLLNVVAVVCSYKNYKEKLEPFTYRLYPPSDYQSHQNALCSHGDCVFNPPLDARQYLG